MRRLLLVILFMLAMLAWAAAQQPGAMPEGSGGQATSPSSQKPGVSQSQPSMSGSADQNGGQSGVPTGTQGQTADTVITEGCLGGSNPDFTITDKAGTTYKLNLPPNTDASPLAPHVGESVQVMGAVRDTGGTDKSIEVSKVGRGTGQCPGRGGQQPKQ